MQKKKSPTRKPQKPSKKPPKKPQAGNYILAWEDDPESGLPPLQRPVPNLGSSPFATRIESPAPTAKPYPQGAAGFRYWAAADALRRGSDFWGSILGAGHGWEPGPILPVDLDHGEDLNAYYDRVGLRFFHGAYGTKTAYSGESPDVVCHEMGHAILDSVRPELWDAASAEVAAFHESFGDMSAILCALQFPTVRVAVLQETSFKMFRSNRVSRLAEQLGSAIRQVRRDLVDPDCLRNAVNSFFYRAPEDLPPNAPASQLSSEPHSFSRVFTAGFFATLANMLALSGGQPSEQQLQQVSLDLAKLLTDAILAAPVVPNYYSQVAGHMVESDQTMFSGKYRDAITTGFVRCGVLSMQSLRALAGARPAPAGRRLAMIAGAKASSVRTSIGRTLARPPLSKINLAGEDFGLAGALVLHAAGEASRLPAMAAAVTGASLAAVSHEAAARGYLEDLLQRGHVSISDANHRFAMAEHPTALKTHQLVRSADGLELVRRLFDCGWVEAVNQGRA